MDRGVTQPPATLVQEEGRVRRAWRTVPPPVVVALQGTAGRGAQRYPTGLAELAFRDVEPLLVGIEVFPLQGKSLADADACAVEKPQQCAIGVRPQRARRRQIRCRRQQRMNLA